MQWYLVDKKRLKAEIELMEDNGVNFELYSEEHGNLLWRGALSVPGHYHSDVRLIYTEIFPSEPMKVYVFEPRLPKANIHVHQDGSICYIDPREWNAEWTAFAVYLTTIRFLEEFYSGRMNDSVPVHVATSDYVPTHRGRSFFEKILDGIFG